MSLPYIWRLLFLCSGAFFLVHAATGLAVRFAAPAAIRLAQRMRSRNAARFLLAVRLLPVAAATFAVFGLCVPSYLRFEPGATTEEVGLACVFAALLGASVGIFSLARVIGAGAATFKFTRKCRKSGLELRVPCQSSPILVIEGKDPVLAIAGAIHPQIIISRGVLQVLSGEQLDAAIRHELAHRNSADNFKRLLLLFAPEILPFSRAFSVLDHAWVKFSEFAADDCAVGDDVRRSLSLASALVRVARMGAGPRLSSLCTSLISSNSDCANSDLFVRVDRLLHAPHPPEEPQRPMPTLAGATVVAAGLLLAVLMFMPSALHSVHEILEHLIH
jgi:Zn-dependent protease with chaperone function